MYKLSDDAMLHKEDEKQYLVNANTGKIFLLNDMAVLIVGGLNEGKELEEKYFSCICISKILFLSLIHI